MASATETPSPFAPLVPFLGFDPVKLMLNGLPGQAASAAGSLTPEQLQARTQEWLAAVSRGMVDAGMRLMTGPEALAHRDALAQAMAAVSRGEEPDLEALRQATGELAALPVRLALECVAQVANDTLAAVNDVQKAAQTPA